MDYSNESFETFQEMIGRHFGEDSLAWRIRDSLFAEAYYGNSHKLSKLCAHRAGCLFAILIKWLHDRFLNFRYANQTVVAPEGAIHFLFLSTRNNHLNRLTPLLLDEIKHESPCAIWTSVLNLSEQKFQKAYRPSQVAGAWTGNLDWRDFLESRDIVRKLHVAAPEYLDKEKLGAILLYLVQFFAWRRFWLKALRNKPRKVISTFEKSPIAKAFFHASWELEVPTRIHWIHGLRHASLQSTLATNLWCMTPGDVRFFSNRVPKFCTPTVKKNPEAKELAAVIGVIDRATIAERNPIHFLFLGPGLEASYSKEMRTADLAIIHKIQRHYGERISWRFRPHPAAIERFESELSEVGIQIEDFSTRHLHDDLRWAHVAGSAWSSLLLDIRETGRPIYWVQDEIRTLGAVDELIEDGIGVHLDLQTAVEKLTEILAPEK